MNPSSSANRQVDELVAEEDLAVSDLLNACDDYCEAIAGVQPELAEDAQRSRNRARARLTTIHERLKQAVYDVTA